MSRRGRYPCSLKGEDFCVVVGTERMLVQKNFWAVVVVVLVVGVIGANLHTVEGRPRRILLDSDIDTDDIFALMYLLKLNRSEFELEVSFNSF